MLDMAQLLVRNVEDSLVRKLKRRARERGVSAEEEHRRILAESLARRDTGRPTLLGFLLSNEGTVAPEVELDLSRERRVESRDTGF
jgi:antitoxin FitA